MVVALSNGRIAQYVLTKDSGSPKLEYINDVHCFPDSALVLSLAVHGQSGKVLSTLSTGEVAIVGPQAIDSPILWRAHDLEVWCGAWKSPDIVLTGGDDAKLKIWDLRGDPYVPSVVSKW